LERTNNFEESMFRDLKRGQGRQVGKKDISREFSFHGPYLPLMRNLTNEHYVAAIVGGIHDLPLRLSELSPRDIAHYLQKLRENRRGRFFEYLNDIDAIELLPARSCYVACPKAGFECSRCMFRGRIWGGHQEFISGSVLM